MTSTGWPFPASRPRRISADEKLAYERLSFVYAKGIGYGFQMGLRPQTLYGIADSPVGLAAYFLDHDARNHEMIARVFAGGTEGLTRDDVLDNVTLTWLTNTALSGTRLYWENKGASFFGVKGVVVPTAVSVFPDQLYPAPRSWAERAYPKLIHYNQAEKGGHFAAWEQPKLFSRRGSRGLPITALMETKVSAQADPMVFATLAIRKEGALFVEIAAPPMNLLVPELVRDLVSLIQQAQADPSISVLVFRSADPAYFISHVDVTRIKEIREAVVKLPGETSLALMFRCHSQRCKWARDCRRSRSTGTCWAPWMCRFGDWRVVQYVH